MLVNQSFINDFAKIIEVSPNLINEEFDIEHSSEWDSLACISTIALIDKYFNVVLESDAFTNIGQFKNLCQLINERVS